MGYLTVSESPVQIRSRDIGLATFLRRYFLYAVGTPDQYCNVVKYIDWGRCGSLADIAKDDTVNQVRSIYRKWKLDRSEILTKNTGRLSAWVVGLVYNWWSWYTRLAFPDIRKEAITSRPLLLSAIGRSTKYAGQTQIYLTPMHAAHNKVERGIENIRKGLRMVRQTAEQYLGRAPWTLLVSYIIAQITQKPWSPPGTFQPYAGLNCFF